jgi:hypothetical protein
MCDVSEEVMDLTASRAVLAPPAESVGRTGAGPKPLAVFLTQLLACRDSHPAYRSRRRADPDSASAAYGTDGGTSARARFDRVL